MLIISDFHDLFPIALNLARSANDKANPRRQINRQSPDRVDAQPALQILGALSFGSVFDNCLDFGCDGRHKGEMTGGQYHSGCVPPQRLVGPVIVVVYETSSHGR